MTIKVSLSKHKYNGQALGRTKPTDSATREGQPDTDSMHASARGNMRSAFLLPMRLLRSPLLQLLG
jgi:hypothetical protein